MIMAVRVDFSFFKVLGGLQVLGWYGFGRARNIRMIFILDKIKIYTDDAITQ